MFISLPELEDQARRRLPRPVFDFIAGGACDEVTIDRNRADFAALALLPKVLPEGLVTSTAVSVFGAKLRLPLMLAPTGVQRLTNRKAEIATARGAHAAGVGYVLSMASSYSLEDVSAASDGPKWFQYYPPSGGDDGRALLIDRATRAGFEALCVTVDSSTPGLRERDARNRASAAMKLTPRVVMSAAMRPRWTINYGLGAVQHRIWRGTPQLRGMKQMSKEVQSAITPISLDHFRAIREQWDGSLIVKGVVRADQCQRLIDLGADGLIVSNHGGRQLDQTPSSISVLPPIVDAVAGRVPVLLDSGVRRGSDIAIALALGATACLLGRPYLYALALHGAAGVSQVVDVLHKELLTALMLLGCDDIANLDRTYVAERGCER